MRNSPRKCLENQTLGKALAICSRTQDKLTKGRTAVSVGQKIFSIPYGAYLKPYWAGYH
jgi:hypothetical protein